MQEIFRSLRPRQRPVIFFAPFVAAHDENLDRLFLGEIILRALEKVLIPVQGDVVFIKLGRGRAEVDVADFASTAGMAADDDEQPLAGACSIAPVSADANVVS